MVSRTENEPTRRSCGKSILDYLPAATKLPRPGEYLAHLANLPAPVLPFSIIYETEILLTFIPAHARRRRGKRVILYSSLAKAYNAFVLQSFSDDRLSFKNASILENILS